MKIIKKTHVLVKTRREVVIGKSPLDEQDEQIVCEQCGGEMMTAQTISALLGINIREIYRLIEKGKFHFSDSQLAVTHICSSTLSRISQKIEQ